MRYVQNVRTISTIDFLLMDLRGEYPLYLYIGARAVRELAKIVREPIDPENENKGKRGRHSDHETLVGMCGCKGWRDDDD